MAPLYAALGGGGFSLIARVVVATVRIVGFFGAGSLMLVVLSIAFLLLAMLAIKGLCR